MNSGPFLPLTSTLIENVPFPDNLMLADLTGPCRRPGSLYLNPFTASPVQKDLPPRLTPWLRTNVCAEGVPPLVKMLSTAPPAGPDTVGSPTIVLVLCFSAAEPLTVRSSGSPEAPLTVIE